SDCAAETTVLDGEALPTVPPACDPAPLAERDRPKLEVAGEIQDRVRIHRYRASQIRPSAPKIRKTAGHVDVARIRPRPIEIRRAASHADVARVIEGAAQKDRPR